MQTQTEAALTEFIDLQPRLEDFAEAVVTGLSEPQKVLSPKFFYDDEGSALFDRICETPEYYVTRTEIALLARIAPEIGQRTGPQASVVEYGSGSSVKIRTLLNGLDRPYAYVAIDISGEHLRRAAESLAADYPGLQVSAICADFVEPFALPERLEGPGRRLGFFPGSTIGNFEPAVAEELLRNVRNHLGDEGALVIGVDLKKDPAILHAAYNDSHGVTAAFNHNVLARINRELGADLDLAAFEHHAFYNAEKGRVEMHLRSLREQDAHIQGHTFHFLQGETIHTENSHKFHLEEFAAIAEAAGFAVEHVWTDPERLFSIQYLAAR